MTIAERLTRERSGLRALSVAAATGAVLGAAFLVLAAGSALLGGARWITLPRFAPFAVWVLVAAAIVAVAVWAARRSRRSASPSDIAAAVERERQLRAGSLRGALEVAGSGSLARRAEQRVAAQLAGVRGPLAPALRGRLVRDGLVAAGAAVAALLLLAAFTLRAPDGWSAIAHPVRAWSGTLLPPLAIVDAPAQLLRGEALTVTVYAPGRRDVSLRRRTTGSGWQTSRHSVVDGYSRIALGAVDADLQLVASDGRAESDTALVRATDRPFLGDVSVRAFYPAYLGRSIETLALGESARLPRGSLLEIRGNASTMLREVVLAGERDSLRFSLDGRRFSGRFSVTTGGTWNWIASGVRGSIPDVPPPLDLEVLPDSAPFAIIVSPSQDSLVLPGVRVPLNLEASDDHGIARVALRTWRERGGATREGETVQLLESPDTPFWTGRVEIDLAGRGLRPGDALHVIFVATDGSPWRQSGNSRELVLRVASLSEQRESARDAADSLVARATEVAGSQEALGQRTENAAQSRDRQSSKAQEGGGQAGRDGETPMSHESAERARSLAAEQRALADDVEEMQQQARQLEEQLRQAGALDSALQGRLREAQQLMQEALTPELAEKLRELEAAAQNLSENQTRQALGDLAAQQQRLREQLERSVEMLRRAALEGMMETLRDEAEDLAGEQRQLSDSLRDAAQGAESDAGKMADRSRDLARDVERLEQRLADEQAEPGAERAGQAAQHAEASAESMRDAADRQRGNEAGAQQQEARSDESAGREGQRDGQSQSSQQRSAQSEAARQGAEQMSQAAADLASARQEQVDAWKSELTSELDRSISEMMQLAREQGALERQARQGASPNDLRSAQGALQQGVQQAGERLQEAGGKSSLLSQRSQDAVSEAERRVEQAAEAAGGTQRGGAEQTAKAMQESARALSQAAASLVQDRDRANSAGSASGFSDMIREMQELAQQQGALNQQGASLLQGQRGEQGSDAARQLSRQQREIARQLEELSGADGTSRTAALAEEARQLAQALDGGVVDASTAERQQRLFRRMLEAGRTLEQDEEDESGRREAQAAAVGQQFTPESDGVEGDEAVRYRVPAWNELRTLSPDERRLVLEYFRRLNASP